MLQINKNLFTYCYCRYLMTNPVMNKNYLSREGKFMKKIMRADAPKKKWYQARPPRHQSFAVDTSQIVSPHVTRRVVVLNKLFMHHVTDLMTTGEVSSELLGRGIEVTHVKLSNDFKVVRVYWFSLDRDVERLKETTRHLEQVAFKLRHELSQLKVIGMVPPILFVRDKSVALSAELEQRLRDADYGEDHVPTMRLTRPKKELILFTQLPEDVKEKILDSEIVQAEENENAIHEGESGEVEDQEENPYALKFPPMKHNVLGLNHLLIMSKVKQALNKKKQAMEKSRIQWSPLDYQQPFNPQNVKTHQTADEMKAFDEFLLKRQIEEKRMNRWETRCLESTVSPENESQNDDDDTWEQDEYVEEFYDSSAQETFR